MPHDCIIVGAGLAGLAAAQRLLAAGLDIVVLEAQDVAGGRVKTDKSTGVDLGPSWVHGVCFSGNTNNGNATADLFIECGGKKSQLVSSSPANWWLAQEHLADECALFNTGARVNELGALGIVRRAEKLFQGLMAQVQTIAKARSGNEEDEDSVSLRSIVDELLPSMVQKEVTSWAWQTDSIQKSENELLLTRVLQFMLVKIELWMAAPLVDLNIDEWAEASHATTHTIHFNSSIQSRYCTMLYGYCIVL